MGTRHLANSTAADTRLAPAPLLSPAPTAPDKPQPTPTMAPMHSATTPSTIRPDRHAYLKWPRLIAFGLVGALGVAATGLSARAIQALKEDRATLKAQLPTASLNATDVVIVAGLMTTAAGLAALYCTALSTAILFRLHREETRRSILVKEVIMATLVIILNRSATITAPGIPAALIAQLLASQGRSLAYRDSIVYYALIVCWVCFAMVLISFVLAALTSRHIKKYGPEDTLLGGGAHHSSSHSHHEKMSSSHEPKVATHHEPNATATHDPQMHVANGNGHTTAV